MNKILENKYPYLTNFFETALKENRLFHSIIFYGSNCYSQYAIALELARKLNCLENGSNDCTCQNCRWIRENRHPAVMTVSKLDNKTDKSKTVISEEQINMVLDTMYNSSEFHRVFIFCDAQITDTKTNDYDEFISMGFNPPQGDEEKIWYPLGLNITCLSSVASNAMLKSLEEPHSGVTFIFLTNSKDDLLPTIVSRSQVFYVPDTKIYQYNTDFLNQPFHSYPYIPKEKAVDLAQYLLNYQLENNLEPAYILDSIQYYFTELIKSNINNQVMVNIIFRDIEKIQESKKMIKSYIKEQTVYEDLAFYLTKS